VDDKLKQRLLSESTYVGTLGLLLENDVASANVNWVVVIAEHELKVTTGT